MDTKNLATGWTKEQTKELFNLAAKVTKEGKGLKYAFDEIAKKTNRKSNSVRNYYYAQAKTFSLIPEMSDKLGIKNFCAPKKADFVTFTKAEVDELVKYILVEQAKGRSVRAITTERAHNDSSVMLRLQNKYRSMIFGRKGYADRIIKEMKAEGLTFFNPLTKQVVQNGIEPTKERSLLESIEVITDGLNESEIKVFFAGLARLVEMASKKQSEADALGDLQSEENKKLKSENDSLKRMLKSAQKKPLAQGSQDKLKDINKFFLAQADKDKIKSLGDYVSELGKILAEIN